MKQRLEIPEWADGQVWEHHWRGNALAEHRHDELEMNLVVHGAATYLVNGQRCDLARGSVVWLFPEQEHVLVDQSRDFSMWLIVARPGLLIRIGSSPANATLLEPNPPGRFCRRLTEERTQHLESLLRDIIAIGESDPDRYNSGVSYALLTAWDRYRQAEAPGQGTRVHPAVEIAVRLIRDEAEPLSLEDIARQAGVSAPWLSHIFHKQIGMPLAVFRNKQRILRFLRLRDERPGRNLTETALDAGFGSYAQFYRVFFKQIGVSPAQFVKQSKT